MKTKSKILIIAGSDSSGGAGIQADIKTVTALGSYAMTAITAVTSQNTTGVLSISAITPKEISNQILFTSKDIKPDAIKIGMLHSSKVIMSVIKSLEHNLKFGQDLGEQSILNFYKVDRLPKTIAMTAITDFLFYGFTSNSRKAKSFLTKGMQALNKSYLKNIFRDIASI